MSSLTSGDGATTQPLVGSPGAAQPSREEPRVRDLIQELARIQDQLTAEEHATGSRPSPGSTRRRAEMLRRERTVIGQLRTRRRGPVLGT